MNEPLNIESLDILYQIRKALRVYEKPMLTELPGIIDQLQADIKMLARRMLEAHKDRKHCLYCPCSGEDCQGCLPENQACHCPACVTARKYVGGK